MPLLRYRGRHRGFNTQPPEGGWPSPLAVCNQRGRFNTQPPEGGWFFEEIVKPMYGVSTHSRLKAAGVSFTLKSGGSVFQHTAA